MAGKLSVFLFRLGVFLFASFLSFSSSAHSSVKSFESKSLVIDVSLVEPSVIKYKGGHLGGFDIELWEAIARKLEVEFTYKIVPFAQIFTDIDSGAADIGIAGISITEKRERKFDFSYPYLDSGLRIMVNSDKEIDAGAVIRSFAKANVLKSFGYLLLFIAICGHIVWFAERGQDAISDSYFPGIFESYWWAFVTMTTVGYGDIAPRKWVGRFVAVIVMFTGIMFFGWFIAVISSSLEVEILASEIRSVDDLRGEKIGTQGNSTSVLFLNKIGAVPVSFETIEAASEALKVGAVAALVFDSPVLEFLIQKKKNNFSLVGRTFNPQRYGFLMKTGNLWQEKINRAFLAVVENGNYAEIHKRYFGH